jgi:hypothetical protein
MILLFVVLLLAWSWVCLTAGTLYEQRKRMRDEADELTAKDAWMNRYERKDVA